MATIDTNGSGISLGGDGFGGNSNVLMFLIFAMIFDGNGFVGRGGYQPQYATQDFVQNGFNFNDLQDQNRDLMNAITGGTAQSVAAANQVYHDIDRTINDKYGELQRDVGAIAVSQAQSLANQNECCCKTLRAIDSVNYNGALNTAALQKTIVEEAQKNRDLITGNRMADMQNQINRLELAQAMNGVVKYPASMAYNAGTSPFCGCGNGCNFGYSA